MAIPETQYILVYVILSVMLDHRGPRRVVSFNLVKKRNPTIKICLLEAESCDEHIDVY